ncbi:MAG: hypothetical protein V9E96_14545 [Chitinophagaceae bacterium]
MAQANIPVVMDGNNATSTVRFLQDSVLAWRTFWQKCCSSKWK